ncbi:MAG: ABC transporter permease [Leucobacter sp.]
MTDQLTPTLTRPLSKRPGLFGGAWIIASLELTQRRRSRTLLILAIIWFCVIGAVTALSWYILVAGATAYGAGVDAYPLFSLIVYFVLLFGTLVAPAISAGSISSERASATLATTQVTLISTWSILLGKALAAWITGLTFLVIAAPFVIWSLALGQFDFGQLFLAILALAVQIGLFTVIGVGLSALISSPLFAVVTAYLLVALLSIGTLIAFSLSLGITTQYVEIETRSLNAEYWQETEACGADQACQEAVPLTCETEKITMSVTDMRNSWWILSLNPYVVVADMVSARADDTQPDDLFGMISVGVRSMQLLDEHQNQGWNECNPAADGDYTVDPAHETLAKTVPVWWIGLSLQLLLAAAALWGGYLRLRTPAKHLPKGSRIA